MQNSFTDEYDYKIGCMGHAGCARGRAEQINLQGRMLMKQQSR